MKLPMSIPSELVGRAADDEAIPVFNQQPIALGLTISMTVLAWLCSLFRLYVRFRIVRAPWWDDLFVMLALMASTSGSVVYCILMKYGMGKHMSSLPAETASEFLRVCFLPPPFQNFPWVNLPTALLHRLPHLPRRTHNHKTRPPLPIPPDVPPRLSAPAGYEIPHRFYVYLGALLLHPDLGTMRAHIGDVGLD
jgi:hypothetical protein